MIPIIEEIKKTSPSKTGVRRVKEPTITSSSTDSIVEIFTIVSQLPSLDEYELRIRYAARYCLADCDEKAKELEARRIKRKLISDLFGSLLPDLRQMRYELLYTTRNIGPDKSMVILEKIMEDLEI